MDREQIKRDFHSSILWTRFGIVGLGIWLLASPDTFGYRNYHVFWLNDWICGFLLLFFGLLSMSYHFKNWVWGACIVGIWLQFAPLLFWAPLSVIYVNETLIGILAIALVTLVPYRPRRFEVGPQIPPGWSYNPSSWQQRIPVITFAIIAWFLARYLASYQLGYIDYIFDPFFEIGSTKVITSMISQKFPVSDAGLGAMAYSLETIMGAKGDVRRWHTMPWIVLIFGILVVPVGFVSIVLVMLQPIAVGAWCGVCLVIALCMLIMLALTVDEVVAALQYITAERKAGRSFSNILLYGSNYTKDEVDERTPSFSEPVAKNIHAAIWGFSIPGTLVLTALIGVWLLFSNNVFHLKGPLADSIDVCGALIVVFSVISWAEVIRIARYINIGISVLLVLAAFLVPGSHPLTVILNAIVCAALVIIFSLFRGPVKEHYGSWDKMIK